MENKVLIFFLSLIFCSFLSMSQPTLQKEESNLQTYIVFLQKPEGRDFTGSNDLHNWYSSLLPTNTFRSSKTPQSIHSYRHVAIGFAAELTAEEAKMLEMTKEVVLVRPQRMLSLHTTHTPSFLGLEQNFGFWKSSNYGKGVIIGVVDSGIAPDHPSFIDKQMPPPPKKWKGKCELNETYSCNNKLIGARTFVCKSDVLDQVVHGTHTASIAAGSPVRGVSYFGQYNGTASGIAPLAHVAMYKVSGRENKAGESEILAAMDAAIEDGVDVLSLSIGEASHPFYDDAIAIGAFAAVQKGILVSCSAGNSGPAISSVENEAPWILTVGASTVDRAIRATVLLGNNVKLDGQSLFQPNHFPPKLLPLIYAGKNGNESSMFCLQGSLKHVDVKGKIVLCEGAYGTVSKGREVKQNGGVAMIVMNDEPLDFITDVNLHVLPASHVSNTDGSYIKDYINTTNSPVATILFKGTVVGLTNAPQVAMFSSRGPSKETPGILKPDIIGPGVDILGACPNSPDNTTNRFVIMSGTSMSCPHLSGVAALLKSSHPRWSPAAIKSAIMTTADLDNIGGNPISDQDFNRTTVFDMGAGHVNPSKTNDPGLIYDIEPKEYIGYLCGLGYSDKHIGIIVRQKVKCSEVLSILEGQLNLPSFSIKLGSTPQMFTRTLTNVGKGNSTYRVELVEPKGVEVKVKPGRISFDKLNQKINYSIRFSKKGNVSGKFGEGYITWAGDGYSVRSPIGVIMLD